MRSNKQQNWVNKLLKLSIIILIILLLLIGLRNFSMFKLSVGKGFDQTNQSIHKLQLEIEYLKEANIGLVQHMAYQHYKIKEMEMSLNAPTEQLSFVQQPTVQSDPVESPQAHVEHTYARNKPFEMISIVTGSLELIRQIIMPRYSFQ